MERDFDIEIGNILDRSKVPDWEFLNYYHERGKMYSKSLRYDWQTGKILLPNCWKSIVSNFSFLKISRLIEIGINHLPDDLTHEIMHKWLHENIDGYACDSWDNIDRVEGLTKYRFSSPASESFFDELSNMIDLI